MALKRHIFPLVFGLLAGGGVSAESTPTPAGAPAGMVAYFTGAGQQTCPPGWTEAQYAQGRLVLAVSDPHNARVSLGTPMTDGTPPDHTHPVVASAQVSSAKTATVGGSNKGVGASGVFTSTDAGTVPNNVGLPYIQYLVCEKLNSSDNTNTGDSFPFNAISFFNPEHSPGGACPTGWSAYTTGNGYFFLSNPYNGKSGRLIGTGITFSGNPPSMTTFPTHRHAIVPNVSSGATNNVITLATKGFVWGGGANRSLAKPGNQGVSGTANDNTVSPSVPLVSLLACQKTAFNKGNPVPLNINIFYVAQNCPDGWGNTDGAPGRFIVGIPGTGQQGLTFGGNTLEVAPGSPNALTWPQHTHQVSGTISVPEHNTDLTTTWHDLKLGVAGSYGFSGQTGTSTEFVLPTHLLNSCSYSGPNSSDKHPK